MLVEDQGERLFLSEGKALAANFVRRGCRAVTWESRDGVEGVFRIVEDEEAWTSQVDTSFLCFQVILLPFQDPCSQSC